MNNMKMIDKITKFICNPKIRFGYLSRIGFYNKMSDEKYLCKEWLYHFDKPLNLQDPQTFNEKLQWLKLYDRRQEYTTMVDKYAVKKYVADKIGDQYIIPTLGVWNSFKEIDFTKLPNQFVLKCTHDSGGIVICRDKNHFDYKQAEKIISTYLKRKYYYCHREWPYKNVPPRIIAEQYMSEDGNIELNDYKMMCFNGKVKVAISREECGLTDYKFYCFNGKPLYLYVSTGLENHRTAKMSFLKTDWTFAEFGRKDYKPLDAIPEKPKNYDEMIKIAQKLSDGIPFLRVDMYEVNGKVYFGELTFHPCAGMMPFDPTSADLKVGKLLDISQIVKMKMENHDD